MIRSMTGFASASGASGPHSWGWELRSVNGKGLDLRLRMPPGYDAIEGPLRACARRSARPSPAAMSPAIFGSPARMALAH